jgi:hypothetical protein
LLTELPGVIGPVIHAHGKSAEGIIQRAEEWIESKMAEIEKGGIADPGVTSARG